MRAGKKIIAIALSVSLCAAAWTNAATNQPAELTFGKYYEPYEPNIEPNAPGYTLPLDLNDIVNWGLMNRIGSAGYVDMNSVSDLIRENGFAILERSFWEWDNLAENVATVYEYFSNTGVPLFITTDALLHLYHVQFDETLKDIEEREFILDINNLTAALLNDALRQYEQLDNDLKEAAKWNVAYLSVAQRLLDPNAPIPELVDGIVLAELAKIKAHTGFEPSDIFIYMEDYSQYVPRGHYTRSEPLKRYFKTMMWYGRMAFLLKGGSEGLVSEYDARIQTLQAFLLATSLKNVQIGERSGLGIWDRLYTVTAFYVGLADDLTPYDYLWALDQVFGAGFVLSDLMDANNLLALKAELALLPSPRIYGGTGNIVVDGPITDESLNEILDKTKGMRLMGQRFVPDSYVFQHLIYPEVDGYIGDPRNRPFTLGLDGTRAYVRGLDVMAVLGSHEALKVLIDEGDTDYLLFWQRLGELKDGFNVLSTTDWNRNLYWSWLYTLRALLDELPAGYPNFMRTQAWQRRQLHSALASWTQLRHDTILYAKPSFGASRGGVSTPPGYIEPIPVFWGRLLALTRMSIRGLGDLNVLTPEARQRFTQLEELLDRMLEIVGKQLTNQQLSSEDNEFIKALPVTFNAITSGSARIAPRATLVADVHTNSHEAQVVEEAGGKLDLIIVACPNPDGSIFLALGPALSYYEFKHPMSDRLTDEAWRELLDSPQRPDRPTWYVPLMGATSVNSP